MAAPPEKTLRNLNGAWVMNKTLSGDSDAVMQLQGIGWLIRKTVSFATVTLHVKQYADATSNAVHIDIDQSLSPGNIKGTSEKRTLNWDVSGHVDHVFGSLRGRSRWTTLARVGDEYAVGPDAGGEGVAKERELDVQFMRDGDWDDSVTQHGDEVVESWVESVDKGWMAWQIWGFELVDGVRRYVRHVVVRGKGGKGVKRLRLVYDWVEGSDGAAATGGS
ncbi:uncharacterized protein J3D65DRAFT_238961 [Phyllosticta citribraziliensis]|uniref:Uncharacterized protein n=1 Tax=Phyllosticta citribraziliensis TaxID=989973 RepID=A0ABR1M0V9_9PEZI